jgi:hypothetical protein
MLPQGKNGAPRWFLRSVYGLGFIGACWYFLKRGTFGWGVLGFLKALFWRPSVYAALKYLGSITFFSDLSITISVSLHMNRALSWRVLCFPLKSILYQSHHPKTGVFVFYLNTSDRWL